MTTSDLTFSSSSPAGKVRWSARLILWLSGLSDLQRCFLLAGFFTLLYLATHSGNYVPNYDGSFYLCVARNIYEGKGLTFNGQPIGNIAPGWPMILAAGMHISRSFFFLGLISVVCLGCGTAIWYLILRRTCSPAKAFVGILLCGLLYGWYSSAHNFFSEASFILCLGCCILLAQQIAEGKSLLVRLPLLLSCTAALILVRWVGVVASVMVVATVVGNSFPFKPDRRWVCAALVSCAALGTFFGMRWMINNQMPKENRDQIADSSEDPEAAVEENPVLTPPKSKRARRAEAAAAAALENRPIKHKPHPLAFIKLDQLQVLPARLFGAGRWIIGVCCPPAELGKNFSAIGVIANVCGWVLWIGLILWSIQRAREGDWLWLGVILYSFLLILRWGNIVPRYLIPTAPLLLLGMWNGLQTLNEKYPRLRLGIGMMAVLFAVVALNGSMYLTDVWIARSSSFGETYMGGYAAKLVQVAEYLKQHGVVDGEVAVSPSYSNLDRSRKNNYSERLINLLTDQQIVNLPPTVPIDEGPQKSMSKWARSVGVRYYLHRTPVSPWRLWHFRTPSLQEWVTGNPVEEFPDWELYEIRKGEVRLVELPDSAAWPRSIPVTKLR